VALLIEGNHMYSNGCGENAIDIKSTSNVIIRDNILHGYRRSTTNPLCGGTGSDWVAIVIHHDVDTILIEKNEIYDSEGAFRAGYGSRSLPPRNVTFKRNLIHDLYDSGTTSTSGYGVQFDGVNDVKFYNNTFVNIPGPLFWIAGYNISGGVLNWDMRNNLFYNGGSNKWDSTSSSELNGTFDYNGWFSAESLISEPNSNIGVDPGFVDLGNKSFRLSSNSQAIDTGDPGLPAGSETDFEGNLIPQDGNGDGTSIADLGVYEYSVSIPPQDSTPPDAPKGLTLGGL
jgi:hypothetical protein